jgi:hypothetical protein
MVTRPITWIFGSVAAVSAAFSALVAYLHPSVTFESYRTVALGSLVTNSCLSPWDRWTEHSTSVVTGPLNSFVHTDAPSEAKRHSTKTSQSLLPPGITETSAETTEVTNLR